LSGPSEEKGRTEGAKGLSGHAAAYQKAAPYLGASTSLVVAVGLFTWLGHAIDEKLGHEIPWVTLIGAALGMVGGFVSFFRTVLGARKGK
jgi:hypothetical protein